MCSCRGSAVSTFKSILEKADRRIPIIFATACGSAHVRKEALDHGAVAFLDKPFGDETLLDAMRPALVQ
jgi:FixJ family two-component response regulator